MSVGDQTLYLDRISYRYRSSKAFALHEVSARFTSNAIAVLGPNGAGKSTLFRILSTSVEPPTGSFGLDAAPISGNGLDPYRRSLGVMPQRLTVFGGYTCAEFLRYVSWLRMADPVDLEHRVSNVLAAVDLSERADAKVKTLSGGMRQRLGLAQALIAEPRLLLLDEPTAGLDPAQRRTFRELLLQVSSACTVVMATHLVEDVAAFAEEVLVLDQGRILFCGSLIDFCGATDGAPVTGPDVERAYLELVDTGPDRAGGSHS